MRCNAFCVNKYKIWNMHFTCFLGGRVKFLKTMGNMCIIWEGVPTGGCEKSVKVAHTIPGAFCMLFWSTFAKVLPARTTATFAHQHGAIFAPKVIRDSPWRPKSHFPEKGLKRTKWHVRFSSHFGAQGGPLEVQFGSFCGHFSWPIFGHFLESLFGCFGVGHMSKNIQKPEEFQLFLKTEL